MSTFCLCAGVATAQRTKHLREKSATGLAWTDDGAGAANSTSREHVAPGMPVVAAGESRSVIAFVDELQWRTVLKRSPAVLFDHPTAEAIAVHRAGSCTFGGLQAQLREALSLRGGGAPRALCLDGGDRESLQVHRPRSPVFANMPTAHVHTSSGSCARRRHQPPPADATPAPRLNVGP